MPRKKADTSHSVPAPDSSQRLEDHVARLQEKQRLLVQETAEELEQLKRQIAASQDVEGVAASARQPLLEEIRQLRQALQERDQEVASLSSEITRLQRDHQATYSQMHGAIMALKNSIRSQARSFDQQVRVFSLDATQTIESMLGALEQQTGGTVSAPAPTTPNPAVYSQFIDAPEPAPQKAEPAPYVPVIASTPSRQRRPLRVRVRKLIVPTFVLLLAGGLSWGGLTYVQNRNGQVAGVSTTATPTPGGSSKQTSLITSPDQQYKEAYADVAFEDTEWAGYNEPNFGVTFRYPKNASNLLQTMGGNNIWVLRGDSYLMKVVKEETKASLDLWWERNKNIYSQDGTGSKGSFKGIPAMVIMPNDTSSSVGVTYVVSTSKGILQFITQNAGPSTNEGKWIAKMIESISIEP